MPFNNMNNNYQASRYIVDADGTTPFATIQSAIDQTNTDGITSATILIRPGTYTENLVLRSGIDLQGSEGEVFVRGTHTPPAAGSIMFSSIKFTTATDVLLDNATAGTCNIKFYNCTFYTDGVVYPFVGYVCNLPNWVGDIIIESCSDISTANSIIFNNGASAVDILDSSIGSGAVGARLSGVTRILNSRIFCDLLFVSNAVVQIQDSTVDSVITLNDPVQGYIYNSYLTHNTSALIDNSLQDVKLGNVVINVAAGDALSGTGTNLELGEVVFVTSADIAGTLTIIRTNECKAGNFTTLGNFNLPNTEDTGFGGIITQGVPGLPGTPFIHSMGTRNLFAGHDAGSLGLTVATAEDNVGLGDHSLGALTSGAYNSACGSNSLANATTSLKNTALGYDCMTALSTGLGLNTAVGYQSMPAASTGGYNSCLGAETLNTTTGARNIAIGYQAGSALVGAESNNIMVGAPGTAADANTIRIGVNGAGVGQQNANYQAGIYQATSGATKEVVWIDSNHKLSSSNLSIVQWVDIAASQTAAVNTGYSVNGAGLILIQLPATSQFGDIIRVSGLSVGLWSITQADAADQIINGITSTTLGVAGHLDATNRYDSVELLCVANHVWKVISSTGALNAL